MSDFSNKGLIIILMKFRFVVLFYWFSKYPNVQIDYILQVFHLIEKNAFYIFKVFGQTA